METIRRTGEDDAPERPRRDREATRRRILGAARDLFGEHGYDGVTVRMIALESGANMALVNRYFGSKAGLFGEVLAGEWTIEKVITEGSGPLPRRLAEHFVRQLHRGGPSPTTRMLDRSVGNAEVREIVGRHLEKALVGPLAAQLGGADARARATLVTTLILGTGPVRRLLGLDDLRDAPPDALTDRLTSMFEAALR
ncbi:TetR family transcriptional regulator [Spirillospora sp. CA-294931]|uniref:TetR/AcrR family transcriptional regulator n=1 Tax=Spirillospora sp. CA-294931 TaxID=3240042 RepID=UPI003D9356A6